MALNGVTYYKRIEKYDGDIPKDCGLTGNEIDDNFYFLRGADIDSVSFEKGETNSIVLHKLNGGNLSCTLPDFLESVDANGSYYSGGTLTLFINGKPYEIDGFCECDCEELKNAIADIECSISGLTENQEVHEELIEGVRKDLDAEISIARKAEKSLESAISIESKRAIAKEIEITDSLQKEISERKSEDKKIADSIFTEKTRAQNEENKLSERINNLEILTGGTATIGYVNSKVAAEEARAKDAEGKLSTRIKAIEDDYLKDSDKKALQSAIDTEVIDRENADTTLDGKITAEKTRAEGKEGELQTTIATEEARAKGAENRLDNRIEAFEAGGAHDVAALEDRVNSTESNIDNLELSAHTHTNKTVLDGIDDNKVAAWDNAEQNAKDYADTKVAAEKTAREEADATLSEHLEEFESGTTHDITVLDDKVAALESSAHTHNNKAILDGISETKVAAWDAAEQNAKDYADDKATEEKNEREAQISSIESKISGISNDIASLEDWADSAESAITELSGVTEEQDNRLSNIESGMCLLSSDIELIKQEISEVNSAITEECTEREAADASLNERVTNLENNSGSTIIDDIKISPLSPFYPLVKGLWDNDIIPSGSTLTQILKIMFEAPEEEMIYFISSAKPSEAFVEGDIIDISDNEFERIKIKEGKTFKFESRYGSTTAIAILPENKSIDSIVYMAGRNASFNGDIADLFDKRLMKIKNDDSGKKYNVYCCEAYETVDNTKEYYEITLA